MKKFDFFTYVKCKIILNYVRKTRFNRKNKTEIEIFMKSESDAIVPLKGVISIFPP